MPSEARSPRLAVLIDADNTSAKIADGLFEEIAKIGEASVRRIYGDFSSARSKGWADGARISTGGASKGGLCGRANTEPLQAPVLR